MSDYYWATQTLPCPCGADTDQKCDRPINPQSPPDDASDPNKVNPAGTMRSWFVGLLFATGIILYVNKGHSWWENHCLNAAGVLAWGIAIFPEDWDCYKHSYSMHGICAVSFFVCIAIVSAVFSQNTLKLIKKTEVRNRFRLFYILFAIAMVASPLVAWAFNTVIRRDSFIYWTELLGIWAFAGYWIVKTIEMSGPDIESMTIEGIEH